MTAYTEEQREMAHQKLDAYMDGRLLVRDSITNENWYIMKPGERRDDFSLNDLTNDFYFRIAPVKVEVVAWEEDGKKYLGVPADIFDSVVKIASNLNVRYETAEDGVITELEIER